MGGAYLGADRAEDEGSFPLANVFVLSGSSASWLKLENCRHSIASKVEGMKATYCSNLVTQ